MPYYRPAIRRAAENIFYIQPPLTSLEFGQTKETIVHTPPRATRQHVLYNKLIGRTLEVSGLIHKATASLARTELEALEAAFNGNVKGVFDFYYWHDRYYKEVACSSFEYSRSVRPSNLLEWSATLVIPDPTIYYSDSIGAGPYEDEVYGGDTDAPEPPEASSPEMAVFTPVIPNAYTGTGAVYSFSAVLPNVDEVNLFQIAFLGCTGFANTAGSITFRFNKTGLSDGSGIALTIDGTDDETVAQVNSGSLVIDSSIGEKLYLVVDSNTAYPVDLALAAYIESGV